MSRSLVATFKRDGTKSADFLATEGVCERESSQLQCHVGERRNEVARTLGEGHNGEHLRKAKRNEQYFGKGKS